MLCTVTVTSEAACQRHLRMKSSSQTSGGETVPRRPWGRLMVRRLAEASTTAPHTRAPTVSPCVHDGLLLDAFTLKQ